MQISILVTNMVKFVSYTDECSVDRVIWLLMRRRNTDCCTVLSVFTDMYNISECVVE